MARKIAISKAAKNMATEAETNQEVNSQSDTGTYFDNSYYGGTFFTAKYTWLPYSWIVAAPKNLIEIGAFYWYFV